MEDRIIQAIKIISKLGDYFDTLEWHKACVEIMSLGLSENTLSQYIDQDTKCSTLGEMSNGNHYVAANFIINFIKKNNNVSFIQDMMGITKEYLQAVQEKGAQV